MECLTNCTTHILIVRFSCTLIDFEQRIVLIPLVFYTRCVLVFQILCIPEDKVIVKENNPALLKQSCIRNKEFRDAESLEFKVDNVVDDSYLQNHRWDKKAESQCRMYELIGLPCLEYALDGYNTTVNFQAPLLDNVLALKRMETSSDLSCDVHCELLPPCDFNSAQKKGC